MNYDELSEKGYIVSTGRGKRIDIYIRVYPEGYGQVIIRREQKPIQPIELMCNNVEEAADYLREIWVSLAKVENLSE